MEHDYLPRCVPVLYPEYVDQQKATSLCADKYQRIITVSDKRRTNMKIMKPTENKFEKNRVSFLAALTEAELKVCTLPEEPYDQIVGIMLMQKLNAIADGRLA